MPPKRTRRPTVKHVVKQLKKRFALKPFAMQQFTVTRPMAIAIIVVCIVGTAMLIVARSSEPTSAASIVPPRIAAGATMAEAPVDMPRRTSAIAVKPASTHAAEAVAGEDVATIQGCLVQDHDQFRLKNTSGEDAPTGRSWKSGFLHRSSKSIVVVDGARRLNLARHVGERVTMTGLLDEGELQGTSLRRIAAACG